jgi:hypothetical protein
MEFGLQNRNRWAVAVDDPEKPVNPSDVLIINSLNPSEKASGTMTAKFGWFLGSRAARFGATG